MFSSDIFYQNPDDFPPGGFRTLIVARGPLESSSSTILKSFEMNIVHSIKLQFQE